MLSLLPVLSALSFALSAGKTPVDIREGLELPVLRGEYLSGEPAVLPQDARGRTALLLFGFSYASRFNVEQWAARFRQRFDSTPGVTFYEIPMIGGMARMGKWFIDSGMRSGTPKSDYGHVITVYSGTDVWKKALGVHDDRDAFLVLIDNSGKVVWQTSGRFDEKSFQTLENAVAATSAR